jgi:hypothetical protein
MNERLIVEKFDELIKACDTPSILPMLTIPGLDTNPLMARVGAVIQRMCQELEKELIAEINNPELIAQILKEIQNDQAH